MKFVSIGGVWLDEIHTPGKDVLYDAPGGSVAFATFGARLFATNPPDIGLIVKTGSDFPDALLSIFATWTPNFRILRCPEAPSARGRVQYGQSSSERTFERLTPSLNITPSDLGETPLLAAQCFHFFDTAAAVSVHVDELCALRSKAGIKTAPAVIWEPHPKSCLPGALEKHRLLLISGKVLVFSPNHVELDAFFRTPNESAPRDFDRPRVEQQARAFLPSSPSTSQPVCIVVRCAEHGCYVLSSGGLAPQQSAWLPSYFTPNEFHCVVDATGAGNAFLGGFAMGWLKTKDFVRAAAYGSVAASFAVEAVGLPDLSSCDAGGRLAKYEARGQSTR